LPLAKNFLKIAPAGEKAMLEIELFDQKGEFWRLRFAACQLNKRDGMWYGLWYVDHDCPAFLRENGARYTWVPLPVFTAWF
jgi:hypothetical protein